MNRGMFKIGDQVVIATKMHTDFYGMSGIVVDIDENGQNGIFVKVGTINDGPFHSGELTTKNKIVTDILNDL